MLKQLVCCILAWLNRLFGCGSGTVQEPVPVPADPRVPRSKKPPSPQIMLRLRDGLGPFASDQAAQEALELDPQWQALLRRLGVPSLKVRRAVGVDPQVLSRLRQLAEGNARRFDFNSPDPKLGSYVYVTLPANAPSGVELVDVYCSMRSGGPLDLVTKVQFGEPPRKAAAGHEHIERTGAGLVVASVTQTLPINSACAIVDIEEGWPFPAPGVDAPANGSIVLERVPIQDSSQSRHFIEIDETFAAQHGAKTVSVLKSEGIQGVTGVAPGAQVYACPAYTDLQADGLPSDMATAVASSADFLLSDKRTQAVAGKVIVIPMQAWDGNPIEMELDSTAATIREVMDAGIPVVTAAGNNGAVLDFPVPNMSALVVAAGTSRLNHPGAADRLTPGSGSGSGVDCFALGDGIASWEITRGSAGWTISGMTEYGETSGASSIIAGAVALMGALRQTNPDQDRRTALHPVQIRRLLREPPLAAQTNPGAPGFGLDGKFMPNVDALKDAIRAL